jgi:hypothetical protein
MTADQRKIFDKVFRELTKTGLLLLVDSVLPSVTTLVTNQSIKGSWWGHKDSQTIFVVSRMLEDHTDVLIMKLVSKKVTFVHRDLWQQIYSVGVARDVWQMKNLSVEAKRLLKKIDQVGFLETNKLDKSLGGKAADVARELEDRLLVHSEQIHTSSGAHAKILESWEAWAKRVGFKVRAKDAAAARRDIEERFASVANSDCAMLPWMKASK